MPSVNVQFLYLAWSPEPQDLLQMDQLVQGLQSVKKKKRPLKTGLEDNAESVLVQ